jgi:hypothetical protein
LKMIVETFKNPIAPTGMTSVKSMKIAEPIFRMTPLAAFCTVHTKNLPISTGTATTGRRQRVSND